MPRHPPYALLRLIYRLTFLLSQRTIISENLILDSFLSKISYIFVNIFRITLLLLIFDIFLVFSVRKNICSCQGAMYSTKVEVVDRSGLEPPTSRLSGACSNLLSYRSISLYINVRALRIVGSFGGGNRDRTGDLLLARQALSQLSYTPITPLLS